MLIAEDILLLLTDDETGKFVGDGTQMDYALAGAVLLELAERGKIDVAEPGGQVKKGRLYVTDASRTGEPALDDALATIAEKDRKPQDVIGKLAKGLREKLLTGLADRGVLQRERGKVLGLFPTTRWPANDSAHEQQLRRKLHDVLVTGATPETRTAAVITMLAAIDAVPKVLPDEEKRLLKRRAKEISEGEWTAEAVRKAIQAVNSAVTAAVVSAASAGAISSAGS